MPEQKNPLIIALLGVILLIAFYCLTQEKPHTTPPPLPCSETNSTLETHEENETILTTVTNYQEGYRRGCDIALQKPLATLTQEQSGSDAFTLGVARGESICRGEVKRIKGLKEDGYKDGCQSAKGEMTKNEKFFKESKHYAQNWKKGYEECKPKRDEQVSKKETPPKPLTKEPKNPPVNHYKKGYSDGCATAKRGYRQNGRLYNTNNDYRDGWDDGEEECRFEEGGMRGMPDMEMPVVEMPTRFYRY